MILDEQSDKVQQLPAAKGAGGRGEAFKSAAARSNLRANAGVLDRRLKASIQSLQLAKATSQRKVPFKGKANFSGTVSHLSDLLSWGHIPQLCWMCIFPG